MNQMPASRRRWLRVGLFLASGLTLVWTIVGYRYLIAYLRDEAAQAPTPELAERFQMLSRSANLMGIVSLVVPIGLLVLAIRLDKRP